MANQWLRLYAEFASDPKVQMLSEIDQRRFVMLLCIRCSNDDETLHDEQIVFQLRVTSEEWERTKGVLLAKNLIDKNNKPIAWDKRQYQSDTSTERVRKHRSSVKHEGNVSVTPPDQSRTEQIQNRAEQTAERNGHGLSRIDVGGLVASRFMPDLKTAQAVMDATPGWDQNFLLEKYNEWLPTKGRPQNPNAAFIGWASKFTKGRRPNA